MHQPDNHQPTNQFTIRSLLHHHQPSHSYSCTEGSVRHQYHQQNRITVVWFAHLISSSLDGGRWDQSDVADEIDQCPSRSQYTTTAIHPSADAPISDALLQFDSMMRTRRTCGDYYAITMIISEGQSGLNTSSIRWLNRWIDNYIMIRLYSPYIPGAKWNGNIDQGWMVPRSLDDTNNNVINAANIFACSVVERNWLNI